VGGMGDEQDGTLNVVLIDDRPDRRRVMRQVLLGRDLTAVTEVDDWATALTHIEAHGTDVVVLEIQIPIETGLAAIAALRDHSPTLPIVVCSFHVDPATKQRALDAGADAYLEKPVRTEDLRRAIDLDSTTRGRPAHPTSPSGDRHPTHNDAETTRDVEVSLAGSSVRAGRPLL
jgi:CheY-like chemotaxis protein